MTEPSALPWSGRLFHDDAEDLPIVRDDSCKRPLRLGTTGASLKGIHQIFQPLLTSCDFKSRVRMYNRTSSSRASSGAYLTRRCVCAVTIARCSLRRHEFLVGRYGGILTCNFSRRFAINYLVLRHLTRQAERARPASAASGSKILLKPDR